MPGLVVIKLALYTSDAVKVYLSPLQNSTVQPRGQTAAQSLKMYTANTLRIRRQVRKKRDYMLLVAVLEGYSLDFTQDLMLKKQRRD